jgi:glycosyltransferase involved in cell wall biosynthesis
MKKRILHLITQLPTGGAEHLLAAIVRELDGDRYESLVCCIQERGELAALIEAAGVPVVCLERRGKRFSIGTVLALARLMRERQIDLVHCHLYHANLYGRLAARLVGIPAIATVHNTYIRRKWHRSLLNRWLGRGRGLVIAVSAEARADVIRHDRLDPQRVLLLPNGIDLTRVDTPLSQAAAKERLGYAADDFVIGCIGRLEEQKGHVNIIRAVGQLLETAPADLGRRLRLLIVGEGRLRGELERAVAASGLGASVLLAGSRSDVAEILRSLDLYVMPSLWEGLSLAMLEAMAAGLAVIISDVGGAAEVLGDGEFGVRVPPGDVGALAAAITALATNDTERRRLGGAARQRVREAYDLRERVRRLEAIYESLLR